MPVAGHIWTACADHLALSLRRLRAALAALEAGDIPTALHVAYAWQELLQTYFSFHCNFCHHEKISFR